MTKAEIDDIFGEFEIDEDYMIKTKDIISLFVAVKEEEKKEPTPPPVVGKAARLARPHSQPTHSNSSRAALHQLFLTCYYSQPRRRAASQAAPAPGSIEINMQLD